MYLLISIVVTSDAVLSAWLSLFTLPFGFTNLILSCSPGRFELVPTDPSIELFIILIDDISLFALVRRSELMI